MRECKLYKPITVIFCVFVLIFAASIPAVCAQTNVLPNVDFYLEAVPLEPLTGPETQPEIQYISPGANGGISEQLPQVLRCTEVPLYTGVEYIGSGMLIDGVTYVPLANFCNYMLDEQCTAYWDQETKTASVVSAELDLSVTLDKPYLMANGRCLFLEHSAYNINGTVMIPVRTLAKVFGVKLIWDYTAYTLYIDTTTRTILSPDWAFYNETNLYWLSRVISSEAGNQPLEGMIGVGNVVLNRVKNEDFFNTVHDVVFQAGQFDVVRNGTIYAAPSEIAVIAAKLCLEGYNTVGDSLYFVNPYIGASSWFDTYKTLVVSIGDHNFYA